jgi:hypothetical protein
LAACTREPISKNTNAAHKGLLMRSLLANPHAGEINNTLRNLGRIEAPHQSSSVRLRKDFFLLRRWQKCWPGAEWPAQDTQNSRILQGL